MCKVFPTLRLLLSITLLSAVGLMIGVYLRGYSEERWIEFMPDDRSFAALFPKQPAQEVEPAPPQFENSEAQLFTAITLRGSYQIASFKSALELKAAETILIADAAARLGGTLEPSERPGDFLLLMGDGSVVFGRVVRTRQRVYRLLASRPVRQECDEEVQLLFESFSPRD